MILDSFTIIDDQVVQQEDIANNYFLTEEDLNKQRGEVFFPHNIDNVLENYSSLSTAISNYSRNIHSTFYFITRRRTRIQ